MVGIGVASLLFVACGLLGLPRRSPSGVAMHSAARESSAPGPRKPRKLDPHDIPLFVYQLTGLLQAGRSPLQLWEDTLEVHREIPNSGFAVLAQPVLQAAHQAAVLGLSVPDVLRSAASRQKEPAARTLWQDLAACLEVSEHSGAPLAAVLARYAAQRESQLDSDAARDTALAGPKATVRLLSWLPLFGLGLGYLIGVDPLAVLLGSPAGIAALVAGVLLMIAGKIWSSKLVHVAAGEHG